MGNGVGEGIAGCVECQLSEQIEGIGCCVFPNILALPQLSRYPVAPLPLNFRYPLSCIL